MATSDSNLADRSGSLVESHKGYDPRILIFHAAIAAMLLTLAVGLGYQQLTKVGEYADRERQQNQRRVLFPGPRGNIYDRDGRQLVGNNHRFSILLHLDELKGELRGERNRIYENFLAAGPKKEAPSISQLHRIARVSLVQRYLDRVNAITGRTEEVDAAGLQRHFDQQLLLPYTLVDNLGPTEYARLLEGLPVNSPLEVFASNVRAYPYGSAAAHTLGYVRPDNEIDPDGFPGDDLTTFKMKGTTGRDGLEKWFDAHLQGESGGRIYRVDPNGYKINPPLDVRAPKQGHHLTTSLDIDLQQAAEKAMGEQTGAAVALDVATGEVLVMASNPSYDLNEFSPRATHAVVKEMNERGAWVNLALNGFYPPGSTFKILTSIAGMRRGIISPNLPIVNCDRWLMVAGRRFPCYNGREQHGEVLLRDAIAESCDIYYYRAGLLMTADGLADEARRFRFHERTGIELPGENDRMNVPDPAWMQRVRGQRWYDGETANVSIGQGALLVTPLQMACFAASVARGDTFTRPTLVHEPGRPPQRNEPINLTPAQRDALLDGMVGCTTHGTGRTLTQIASLRVPFSVAGKTGTAQIPGKKNVAWFICFAPREKPEIAVAVAMVGDVAGEEYSGGMYAAPVAGTIIRKYFDKKTDPGTPKITPFKTE